MIKKSKPVAQAISCVHWPSGRPKPTNDQAFHFLLPKNVDVERLLQLVVELVSSPSSGYDTQFVACLAIALFVLLLELSNEVDADVDPVGFEV